MINLPNSAGLFLYFLPGLEAKTLTRKELLVRRGGMAAVMSDALRSQRNFQELVSIQNVAIGPSGSSGALLAVVPQNWSNPHKLGYHPDEQTWKKVICAGSTSTYYLGHARDCVPTPESLQRETLVSGYELELGDGNIWIAPTIRRWSSEAAEPRNNLPLSITWDETGECLGQTIPAMRWAWDIGCDLWNFRCGLQRMTLSEFNGKAVQCLSVNYRLGIHEASMLDLITSANADSIVDAAIDQQLINEFLAAQGDSKKNQSAPAA